VRYAVGKTVALVKDDDLSLNIPMAAVAEAIIAVDHSQAKYWNDLGLFCRDAGEHLTDSSEEGDAERALVYLERSWESYQHAMTLAPTDPAYINDGAVVLHIFLKRDLDQAEALYGKAIGLAQEQIAAGGLDEAQLRLVQQALGDAQKNLETLRKERAEAGN
jgi:tetratricopeptide (TPR) repeat protein